MKGLQLRYGFWGGGIAGGQVYGKTDKGIEVPDT
jgi:hypothetical protein